ncbi:MAG: penicillin-binding transpeptidase domain-containing protein, partial [Anaerovorax sp.]
MNKLLRSRNGQLVLLVFVLMAVLGIRLFALTIVQGASWSAEADGLSVKSIRLSAPRGEILDRYGRVLATNTPSFTVYFSAGDLTDKEINKVSSDLIDVLEKNGDEYFDNFPIIADANGEFYYTYQREIEEWLASEGMPTNFFAEQAFEELKNRNNLNPGLDKYEAQSQLQNTYGIYPPISVKNMKYTKELDKESFLGRYSLDYDMSAREAFDALRKYFEIPGDVSDDEARKIMVIRNELSSQGYKKYMPAKIAAGISSNSIIIFEEKKNALPGVEIVAESIRTYPNGSMAAHVLGYLGKISESEKNYYKEKGYDANDMVGQEGIEKSLESKLKGSDGVRNVQVNAFGELVKVIDNKAPTKGKDVTTTLDLELQKIAEESLEKTLTALPRGGTYQSKWGNYTFGKAMGKANSGAVVVLDAKTSEVLAMSSYPDFDPNLFATGISKENWDLLQSKNPRDPMGARPLYNIATRTPVQPGSTFKMVTATAALESGLNPQRRLYDGGVVMLGQTPFGCLIWNQHR